MNSTASAMISQQDGGGITLLAHHKPELSAPCLYFLVCSASGGPRAGLFKLGITENLVSRYKQHTKLWEGFDLGRSARLRGDSYKVIKSLETILKVSFDQWRRHPGSNENGHTEFFAMDCLAEMLAFVENLSVRALGAQLSRGIDPAECLTSPKAKSASVLGRQRLGDASAEREERKRQKEAEREGRIARRLGTVLSRPADRQIASKMQTESDKLLTKVLGFAMAYQEYLILIDLTRWRESRTMRDSAGSKHGSIFLYFRDVEPLRYSDEARLVAWMSAWYSLQDDFAASAAFADSINPNASARRRAGGQSEEGLVLLVGGDDFTRRAWPRSRHEHMLRVHVGNGYFNPFNPLFGMYEKLAIQVDGGWTWDQAELRLGMSEDSA